MNKSGPFGTPSAPSPAHVDRDPSPQFAHLKELGRQVEELEAQIQAWYRSSDLSSRLAQMPGIGPITASALVASVGDAKNLNGGRQLAAWLGLVPRQHSSGGKSNLLGVSKRGDSYLRILLIHGARSVIYRVGQRPDQLSSQFIAPIDKLYRVEALAKEQQSDASALLLRRGAHSVPVLEEIQALLLANIHAVLPGSLLGKALHYPSSEWSKLQTYVQDDRHPIDNNACENSIRPFVIGRRN